MMTAERVTDLFNDAWHLYGEALEILNIGKPRIAAEVAWGATKRATDALLLARTGREPAGTGQTSRWLKNLGREDANLTDLADLYQRRIVYLHGHCFYSGDCAGFVYLIPETSEYIREAERLAGVGMGC